MCAVELDRYCRDVLLARQRDGILPWFPIWDDVRTFDGTPFAGSVDVVAGGFPCQDISQAGRGAGIDGERSGLWSEFARVVCEVRPRYVFVENSPMLTSRGLGRVLGDLAEVGYDARWCVLGADDVGAPHRRKRIWILAHAVRDRCEADNGRHTVSDEERYDSTYAARRQEFESRIGGDGADVTHSDSGGLRKVEYDLHAGKPDAARGRPSLVYANGERLLHGQSGFVAAERGFDALGDVGASGEEVADADRDDESWRGASGAKWYAELADRRWWEVEPPVGRLVDGCADRVAKLRALGNAQVPSVVALAWKTLMSNALGGAHTGKDVTP